MNIHNPTCPYDETPLRRDPIEAKRVGQGFTVSTTDQTARCPKCGGIWALRTALEWQPVKEAS